MRKFVIVRKRLQVNVAEGALGCAHKIPHLDGSAGCKSQVNGCVQSGVGGRGRVEKGASARDTRRTRASLIVEELPDPPDTIDISVMQVEEWIDWKSARFWRCGECMLTPWRSENVAPGITTHSVMTATMNSNGA
jgi:hypothetical protein